MDLIAVAIHVFASFLWPEGGFTTKNSKNSKINKNEMLSLLVIGLRSFVVFTPLSFFRASPYNPLAGQLVFFEVEQERDFQQDPAQTRELGTSF